tara:strand:+ start:13712 stop:13846 length:135 start_codon:yes stop_codon:yes gene_type:complete
MKKMRHIDQDILTAGNGPRPVSGCRIMPVVAVVRGNLVAKRRPS